jgi:2,4-dienoyl-CoA reductase-like NADH-dependent reductase (Old Yellow Enzyme family)/thioredoxin reductase
MSEEPLWQPLSLGRHTLRNRIMLPPHGRLVGDPFGPEHQARRAAAYWGSRAADGVAWICGLNGFVDNSVLIPGFDPVGLGATVRGVFRLPHFHERAARYVEAVHAGGALASVQLIAQGGMPHSPSGRMANHASHQVPHVLTREEIAWFVEEYRYSAQVSREAGLDGVELHANHEDLLQLFLSPATNVREDEYGGSLENRARIVVEILSAVREAVGPELVVGVRLNVDELFEGGYDLDGGLAIARHLEATGHIDYVHCVVGNNWGAPSYIQTHHYRPAQWSEQAARFRAELGVPVVYSGRVSSVEAAAEVVGRGHADVVGMARAMFAEPHLVSKARSGRADEIRPCIGTNDCLHRVVVEGIRFGCSVNPETGHEGDAPAAAVEAPRQVLVVGGGPAGMELAALLAEAGHRVSLWERDEALGGQLRVASVAAENAAYRDFLAFQGRRLAAAGVDVRLGVDATADAVLAERPDVVAVATGAAPRRPDAVREGAPGVVEGRDVLLGRAEVGERVLVVAEEDHMQPLTVAGHLADLGCSVTVLYSSPSIAPTVGKYSIGAPLAKLSAAGAQVLVMERVVAVEPGRVVTRNTYSGAERVHDDIDTVVLACGGRAETALYDELRGRHPEVHVLGDAYAPRRMSFATRQAYELARTFGRVHA